MIAQLNNKSYEKTRQDLTRSNEIIRSSFLHQNLGILIMKIFYHILMSSH